MRGLEMMSRRRWIGSWFCVVGLLASCTANSSTPPEPSRSPGARIQSTGTPPSLVTTPSGLLTLDENGLVFDYPAAWRVFHNTVVSSFSNSIADLATVDVPEPCATTTVSNGTQIDCADRFRLTPDSLVVHITGNGFPGFDVLHHPLAGAEPIVIGGLPAFYEEGPPSDSSLGADTSLTWTLSRPSSVDNYYTITALIRGPDLKPMTDALQALVASLHYDPPVVPLPLASGAPEAALAKALGMLGQDSETYRCFPTHVGTAQADISGWPNGPGFGKSHHATCTTQIERTALQLWLATFTIQLAQPDPDPNIGSRWVIESWLQPDGTPGETTSGPSVP